ncbi:DUF3304 domain-containing protein [Pseudoduganella sp. UC29_106]|uniref:DUF3304 domain-containing protein n=1 Tax=Pseudoduganella sp. UC29_106 TaxID=3374553 RepID=UPI003756EB14
MTRWRGLTIGAAILLTCGLIYAFASQLFSAEKCPIDIEGYQYLPKGQRVYDFYLNTTQIDVSSEGGGVICCILLPRKWRASLFVDVRWSVWDWSEVSNEDLGRSDGEKPRQLAIYRARVPVERYGELGRVYVHVFEGGRVRIVPSQYGPSHEESPVKPGDPLATFNATQGTLVTELFTKEEHALREREYKENRKKYGDWR